MKNQVGSIVSKLEVRGTTRVVLKVRVGVDMSERHRAKITEPRARNNKSFKLSTLFFLASWVLLNAYSLAKTSTSPHFIIETASSADEQRLPEVFQVLEQAYKELVHSGYRPPVKVRLVVHANLESFRSTTKLPWFVLAVADQSQQRIDIQRLRIVAEKGLQATLRHELFHLAQPPGWPRWKAEGMAMHFAGQRPVSRPLDGLSDTDLDKLLVDPRGQETLSRAMAIAYWRVEKTSSENH